MGATRVRSVIATAVLTLSAVCQAQSNTGEWVELFNGTDLDDWTVKIRGYPAGENYANTFRIEDGLMTVRYDQYEGDYNDRFGHIFHKDQFSHYRILVEYRFIGEQVPGAPGWAIRNSGVMLHAQDPHTMPPEQDFPVSIEAQFLGGLGDGKPRPTANMCSPGSHIEYQGKFEETHCINSASATFDGEQWVTAEVLVLGSDKVVHYVNGEEVMRYANLTYGGVEVSGHRPEMKPDGEPLSSGYVSLQSESAPIQFRRVAVLNLRGCMNPEAENYKSYFVEPDPEACTF